MPQPIQISLLLCYIKEYLVKGGGSSIKKKKKKSKGIRGKSISLPSEGLLGLAEPQHLPKVAWLDAVQGKVVVYVTSSYWGDVDHGQMLKSGLEGVYSIVNKGKQFKEFRFHF